MLKKVIIISKKSRDEDKNQAPVQGYDMVLANYPSMIDLPREVNNVLISKNKIKFKVISWCMFPVIWAGDSLKIEPIEPKEATIGDTVLYKFAGRAYAHRLIKKYEKEGELYIVTGGEKEYGNNRLSDIGGVSAGNILGKVTEVKRGKLCFKPDDARLRPGNLIRGRLKLSVWTSTRNIEQFIGKILIRLQRVRLYRCFLKKLIKNKVSFFVGHPFIKDTKEINNFCFYRRFGYFSEDFADARGLYNISARINNWPIGNISLFFDMENPSYKTCTLSNFIVRIPCRGAGIGCRLVEKALYLCDKINAQDIKIALSEGNKIAVNLFKKMGFEILK